MPPVIPPNPGGPIVILPTAEFSLIRTWFRPFNPTILGRSIVNDSLVTAVLLHCVRVNEELVAVLGITNRLLVVEVAITSPAFNVTGEENVKILVLLGIVTVIAPPLSINGNTVTR